MRVIVRRVLSGSLPVAVALIATAALSWQFSERGGVPLDGRLARILCGLTETGGVRLVPVVLLAALGIWATDRWTERSRRQRESLAMLGMLALALPAAMLLNEYVLKRIVAEPRPSHRMLMQAGFIPDPSVFDRLDEDARQDSLESRLGGAALPGAAARLAVHPVVLVHWIHETGYTFPSGHALNAFMAAVFFLGGAFANPTPRRRGLAGAMLGWAVAVALTRVLLLVHRPVDVTVGALLGAALGGVLVVAWWRWTQHP
jgi:phosphatidylglycerophosphatase B